MKSAVHYAQEDLVAAIRGAGIGAGNVVSLQVSLGRLGLPRDVAPEFPAICRFVTDVFLEVLGPGGTLVIPTYTYSIGRGEVFEVEATPSSIGDFPELFRKRPGALRSRDPMLSSAAIGPHGVDVLRTISRSCYGEGSTYQRLREHGAKICTLGLGLHWATFRHHIEEMAAVPFRFRKLFHGIVRERGIDSKETWSYFAAPFVDCCQPMGLPLEHRARAEGLARVVPVGRGEIVVIDAEDYFKFGVRELRGDPWLTAKGPRCSLGELVRLEDARVGAPRPTVTLEPGASMTEMVDALWRLRRDLVSDGHDVTLEALGRQVPMRVHEYPSGTECLSWIVPEKWTCREAYVEGLDGRRIFSYADNPLHVASYSHPFKGVVTRDELFAHLHVHPILPDATPYLQVLDRRDWWLCCSEVVKATLTEERYRVVIDAAFSYGTLKIGDVVVRGQTGETILLCAHLGHPGQVNDGLSGAVVGIEVMRELAGRRQLECTYRLLVFPEAGSIACLGCSEALTGRMRGGIFIDMAGLDSSLMLQHSADPGDEFDRCCDVTLRSAEPDFRTCRFDVTNDESFSAAGGSVPMVSLSRGREVSGAASPRYDEHHSDRDDPALASSVRLRQTVDAILAIIDAWERNVVVTPRFPDELLSVQHGADEGFGTDDAPRAQARFAVMRAMDRPRSTVDIACRTGQTFEAVSRAIAELAAAGFVECSRPGTPGSRMAR